MSDFHKEVDAGNTKFITQLIDSMLTLINGLVDDITNIHGVQKDVSIIETKLAFLLTQITQLESICRGLVGEERFRGEVHDLREKINKLEEGIKKLNETITVMKEAQITGKKDVYIEQGKLVIIVAILLTVVMQMVPGLLKRIATLIQSIL